MEKELQALRAEMQMTRAQVGMHHALLVGALGTLTPEQKAATAKVMTAAYEKALPHWLASSASDEALAYAERLRDDFLRVLEQPAA